MDSIYYLDKAIKHTLVCLSFFVLPDFTSILVDANLIENPKDYSVPIFVAMNYLCYIMSFVFFLSSIRNLWWFNLDKKEPASTVRTQIKIPTQNKKETLDKIVNF